MKNLHNQEAIAAGKYPPMKAHEKLMSELKAINLAPKMSIEEVKAQEWYKILSKKELDYYLLLYQDFISN